MSAGKNISFKRTLKTGLTVILTVGFLGLLLAASFRQASMPVAGIQVHLNEENANSFLQKKEIKAWLLQNPDIKKNLASMDKLDLKKMERIAETNPWVANAEIYIDNSGILQMDIVQREPVARIFCADGSSFYIDSALKEMPVKLGCAFPAPVFTNVTLLRNDSMNHVLKRKISSLSVLINKDSFWHAQIEQIEVQPDQTFVLIPLLGDQRIILGDTSRLEEKLDNLFAFYRQVPGRIGWNAYNTLDLRFKDQIIAAPSLETPVPKSIFPAVASGAPEMIGQKADEKTQAAIPATARSVPVLKRGEMLRNSAPHPKAISARGRKARDPKTIKQKTTTSGRQQPKKETKPKYIYPGK